MTSRPVIVVMTFVSGLLQAGFAPPARAAATYYVGQITQTYDEYVDASDGTIHLTQSSHRENSFAIDVGRITATLDGINDSISKFWFRPPIKPNDKRHDRNQNNNRNEIAGDCIRQFLDRSATALGFGDHMHYLR